MIRIVLLNQQRMKQFMNEEISSLSRIGQISVANFISNIVKREK